ncbi:hypothetical protein ASPVEDRAFT_152368 [Aspergillus versicolor CBS 583.65]|uniref:Rhodopsin domain-containing protein n=1 Tax=Aspergillus versicolor CBS 583.65 TaxID=1036611 RepID=A0A1L9PR11_ASPVE|nr:uncharacterized protein ASPVEDRAFT_152368 [Aspergillus versicolor CBS 583.65]OJJ03943.1 hypothetical protein ASPVEDRAFT_152368 [Aspergillus versicolor CBS 583.65]
MISAVQARGLAPDEQYQQSLAYGLIIGTAVLSLVVCGLRLYTRSVVIKSFGADDIAVCVALAVTQAFNGLGIAVVYHGQGQHMQNVSPEDRAFWLKLYYAAMCLYLYASMAVKLSILTFLRRIFVNCWMQRLTAGLMVFQVAFSVSGSFVLAFQCSPARAAFDMSIKNPNCYTRYTLYQITLYQAVLIFVGDLIMLLAPVPVLIQLKMPTRKIVALLAIFGSGIIACIAPIVRFSTLDYLRVGSNDLTFDATSSLYWMAIEFNLGLVAGSLSSLKPLPLFRKFGSSKDSKYKESSRSNPYELQSTQDKNSKKGRKKPSLGMGTTILQETGNESQEQIFQQPKGDYLQPR